MLAAVLMLFQAAPALPPAPYTNPSAEAVALGTRLAEQGTLASLLPMIAAKETDELVAQHPELSATEQVELRRTAAATLASGSARLFAVQGRAYAERLSPADLRVLVHQAEAPANRRYRAALVPAIAATMGAVGTLDFKGDTMKAFCAKTGKGCERSR